MVENSSVAQKHTSGEAPKVCSVCTIACSQAMLAADAARVRRNLAPVAARSHGWHGARHASQYERLPQASQAGRCCS